jgi:hypothetical protein
MIGGIEGVDHMIAEKNLFLRTTVRHQELNELFDAAAEMRSVPGEPRKGFEAADRFLDAISRHLSTVESVLLPAARKNLKDHGPLLHEYVRVTRDLETALVIAKGREYGSVYSVRMQWADVWSAVRSRLQAQQDLESGLVTRLSEALGEDRAGELVQQMADAASKAMTRPHPHAPHLGMSSALARRFLHLIDSFWDTAEGRMAPEQPRQPHKEPGPMGQYLLADPRFDTEE